MSAMDKQAFNPYLPLNEHIPDGEVHVFGGRAYLFGSHDKANSDTFCALPYCFYSAPIDDLSNWTCPGIAYEAKQDPLYEENERCYLYAPDVVRGNDGRYYLYYCLAGYRGKGGYSCPISVAVSDTPDIGYEYLGVVSNKDGTPFMKYVNFDPAVINDEGTIRLYFGCWYPFDELRVPLMNNVWTITESKVFGKDKSHIKGLIKKGDSIFGPIHVELEDDMMTIKSEPVRILPLRHKGSEFAEHGFFEGSSIRKINGKYYFVYSSLNNHELCYAVSDRPDRDFHYKGTIVSNGDIYLNGRKKRDRMNLTGTNHGCIEKIGDDYFVFYHRLTNKSDYSRQSCAERINIDEDGNIAQVPITSCGLNKGSLRAEGTYPASICCHLTNGKMPHGSNRQLKKDIPYVGEEDNIVLIKDISNGTLIGYKSFDFVKEVGLRIGYKGSAFGQLGVYVDGVEIGKVSIRPSDVLIHSGQVRIANIGKRNAYLTFRFLGKGKVDIVDFSFE